MEPVKGRIVKSIDEIPAVCLEDDLIAILRLKASKLQFWRMYPDFIPFPPLPMLDRHVRVSGCVVAWFLAQDPGEYHRVFKSPLETRARAIRGRNRPPWWTFAPPHSERVPPLDGENALLGVKDVAKTLRTKPSALRRAAADPDFVMPPASPRPMRWTEGQIERLLWAPQDHEEHRQAMRRRKPGARARLR